MAPPQRAVEPPASRVSDDHVPEVVQCSICGFMYISSEASSAPARPLRLPGEITKVIRL